MGRGQGIGKGESLSAFVALLRGVNVGGANKLSMSDLADAFTRAGALEVETYIQSGNVVFAAAARAAPRVAAKVEAALDATVALVEAGRLARIVAADPFAARGVEANRRHVAFFAAPVARERLASLDPNRSPPDEFRAGENCLYLLLPNGAARTKLTSAWLDSWLGVTTTARNWTTTTKLSALASALQASLDR